MYISRPLMKLVWALQIRPRLAIHVGLELYEYMLLAEELGSEPIYVVNSGFSHLEATSPQLLRPFLEETLGALEFLTGEVDGGWGAVRASMGRDAPWEIYYLGIGNEVGVPSRVN